MAGMQNPIRHDVLRHPVHFIREANLILDRRPRCRQTLVRFPTKQLDVGVVQFVQLELVTRLATIEAKRPAPERCLLAAAWIFHDSVEREELGNDQTQRV